MPRQGIVRGRGSVPCKGVASSNATSTLQIRPVTGYAATRFGCTEEAMSEMFYVVVGIGVAALGLLLVRERRYGQVLTGAACLAFGLYLTIDGLVTINGLLH